ncbi:MAG TPA: hypothetical protein VM553_17490 [Dongiaceae bacterium]|nr:hypothetical protein [Dongiaceae bacterium]
MGHVIVIFGTLIALNMGFGYWLSEENAENQPKQGVVEVEDVQTNSAVAPAPDAPAEQTKPE